ncbi:MAG: hypothetical protein A2138_26040 [Deltaproteobacteria bacterium RBG_16_71_12]|nr:MAG: hypothetical protein A2138_26040 [Deltaproteobacteria bacterium RBG_16_71_12]
MRRAAFLAVVFVVSQGCQPRVPPPPAILPLDTDALAIGGIERAQDTAERLVALAGVVGAFIGTREELNDTARDGGLDRVVERAELASAACDAVIERDAAGAVHASWGEPCTLATGTVVTGGVSVTPWGDGDTLWVTVLATADGVTLNGLVGLTPQFWPVAWLMNDINSDVGFATVALFSEETRVAPDDAGVFVIDLPSVMIFEIPWGSHVGAVGSRVCAPQGRTTILDGLARRADQCAIAASSIAATCYLVCAGVEGELGPVTGTVGFTVSPHTPGPVDVNLTESVDGHLEAHALSLELRPLGCR